MSSVTAQLVDSMLDTTPTKVRTSVAVSEQCGGLIRFGIHLRVTLHLIFILPCWRTCRRRNAGYRTLLYTDSIPRSGLQLSSVSVD